MAIDLKNRANIAAYRAAAARFTDDRTAETNWATRVYRNHLEARKKGHVIELRLLDEMAMILTDCVYCGRHATAEKPNGVDRRDNNRGYTYDNCVPCCHECNYAKRSMSEERWLAWLDRVVAHRSRAPMTK